MDTARTGLCLSRKGHIQHNHHTQKLFDVCAFEKLKAFIDDIQTDEIFPQSYFPYGSSFILEKDDICEKISYKDIKLLNEYLIRNNLKLNLKTLKVVRCEK